MTATNPIRVVQWGLGAMGQGMAKLITAKDGLELVSYTHLTLPTICSV